MPFVRLKTKMRPTSYDNRLKLLDSLLSLSKNVKIDIHKKANEFIARLEKEAI